MANEAKIKIIVNANQAIDELTQLQKEVDFTQKSFSKLANKNGGFDDDSFKQITNLINYRANALTSLTPGYEGIKEAASYVNSEVKKLTKNYSLNSDQLGQLISMNNDWASSIRTTDKVITKSTSGLANYGIKLLDILKNIMGFQLVIATVRKTMTGISRFFSDSTKLAAEAEQVYSKLATVFDDFSYSASKASKELAKNLGLAQSTASSALSTIGDLLQAQGMGVAQSLETASDWAKQLQDIIAFKDLNMSLEEFAQTFMSGAAGNLRNFRTFGSIVKESAVNAELARRGYDKLTGSELELAKMTTRAELALKQQANAVGATSREWETMLSVNRRLTEQQKRLKENVGEAINVFFKPVKDWWTAILEETNKAIEAQKNYNEGAKSPYDVTNNQKDFNTFAKALDRYSMYSENPYLGLTNFNPNIPYQLFGRKTENTAGYKQLQELDKTIVMFGATVDQTISVLQDSLSEEAKAWLKAQEENRKALEENTKAIENEKAGKSTLNDSYQNFFERISSITGVSGLIGSDFENSKLDLTTLTRLEKNARESDLYSAIRAVSEADAKIFGDQISVALDELANTDLLQLKADSLRSLFEESWNNAIKNGEDPLANEQVNLAKEQYLAIKQQIDILKAQEEATENLKKAIEDNNKNIEQSMQALVTKINPFASTFNAYEQGSTAFGTVDEATGEIIGSTLGGILGILADIASQTEAFAAATSFITDYIVPAFNTIFRPLLPMIEFIGKTVQMLVVDILAPLMPIFQIIASVIVMILTPIRIVAAIIKNIFTAVHNIVEFLLHPLTGGNKWEYENLKAIIDETDDYLKKIWECNLEIADNTDPTKSDLFKAYDEMFNQKMINASEYQSLLGSIDGLNYDRLQTWDNGTYRNGSGGTTVVYSGGISFTVNGTNLSSEEIFREFERWLARQQMAGAGVY